MAKTIGQLDILAAQIEGEQVAGANTASRVGGLFSDIVTYLDERTITSSTDRLKIEVVSALPPIPDSNTVYIVQPQS